MFVQSTFFSQLDFVIVTIGGSSNMHASFEVLCSKLHPSSVVVVICWSDQRCNKLEELQKLLGVYLLALDIIEGYIFQSQDSSIFLLHPCHYNRGDVASVSEYLYNEYLYVKVFYELYGMIHDLREN